MKSLETIQKVSKFAKIVSKIIYVLCFIALIFVIIAAAIVALLPNNITIDPKQFAFIEGLDKIDANIKIAKGIVLDPLIYSAILLIGELYIANKAVKYFKFELEEGTPFSEKSADKIKELGILTIAVPIITSIVALIAHIIMKALIPNVVEFQGDVTISLTMGLVFLFLSAVFRYGASLKGETTTIDNSEEK